MKPEEIIQLHKNIKYENLEKAKSELEKKYNLSHGEYGVAELKKALDEKKPVILKNHFLIGHNGAGNVFVDFHKKEIAIERMVKAIIIEGINHSAPEENVIDSRDPFVIYEGVPNWNIAGFRAVFDRLKVGELFLPPHSAIFVFSSPTAEQEKQKIVSMLDGVKVCLFQEENYIDNAIHEIGHLFWRDCVNDSEKKAFKSFFKLLRHSAIFQYEWEKATEEEVFCTIYKWYVKSVLINKSFYNILEHEENKGLMLFQECLDRVAKDRQTKDIWDIAKHEVIEYLNPVYDKTTGRYLRKAGAFDRIKDIEIPADILLRIDSYRDGLTFIDLEKALVPVDGSRIDWDNLEKAKYIRRTPKPGGGWNYVYKESQKREKKVEKPASQTDSKVKTEYAGPCDRLRQKEGGENFWQKMMDSKKQIKESEFLKNVNIKNMLDDDETWNDFKELAEGENDPVKLYESDNAFFVQRAGFEFIWKKKVEDSKGQSMTKAQALPGEKPTLFLDMDGVVADFVKGYKEAFHRDAYTDDPFTIKQYVMQVPGFFRNLPVIEKGRELVDLLKDDYKIVFLTTPMDELELCRFHKLEWIRENFGPEFDVIFSHSKSDYVEDEKSILIDDMKYNLDPWAESGGTAIDFNALRIDGIIEKIEAAIYGKKEIETLTEKLKKIVVNPEPTEKEKETGNYKKGEIVFKGLNLVIENVPGSIRLGGVKNGRWMSRMKAYYGYIKKTEGADGDNIDVFIGPRLNASRAFVINQNKPDGMFDECKIVLGCETLDEAINLYLSHYPKGWERNIRDVVQTNTKKVREWSAGRTKFEPFV